MPSLVIFGAQKRLSPLFPIGFSTQHSLLSTQH